MTKDNNLQSRASMRRFINWAEVKSRVSLSRSTVWRRIHEGSFPAPVQISRGRVAWLDHEIESWISTQLLVTNGAQATKPSPIP